MAFLSMISPLPQLLLLLLLPSSSLSQTSNGTVPAGWSINVTGEGAAWRSPSGDFAFGFRNPLDYDKNSFLLSIWYDKIPGNTIVWYARDRDPALAPRGSKLELSADRGLLLTGPQGEELWKSDPVVGVVSRGALNDKGNLLLEDQKSGIVWESFKSPTDTLLPGQMVSQGGSLYSMQSETNLTRGRFRLSMNQDSSPPSLELATLNVPSDYSNEPYYSREGNRLDFNESGLFILNETNHGYALPKGEAVSVPAGELYHRAVLNFDGVFTHLYRRKGSNDSGPWTALSTTPENICMSSDVSDGSGVCGYNRVCKLDVSLRPICECQRGFTEIDQGDEYRGCRPDFIEACKVDGATPAGDLYNMETITDVDWPTSDFELLQPYNQDQCKESCLQDCMCAVSILRDVRCWKKKLPLSNGKVNRSVNGKAFIKVRKQNVFAPPPPTPQFPNRDTENKDGLVLVVSVLLGSSVFINFMLIGGVCMGFFFIYHKKLAGPGRGESGVERTLHCFTYKELEDATDGFKEELGRGSFGIVYKGVVGIGSASTLVAVKKLDRVAHDRDKEFKTEVNTIGQTHHKNLVRLIGFCDEGQNRMLVYEFLSNGSLASFLFGDLRLTWAQRTQIACSIARGLVYLHEECSTQIIHCDIKPQNILLDDFYNARISDFGLAKLLSLDQTQTSTAIRGTRGYVSPEWFRHMPITTKVDVYSFGVMLLEIICCRRSVDEEIGGGKEILMDWAYDCYREGKVDAVVENDEDALADMRKLERYLMVSIWCLQEDPSLRPTMKKVLLMLEGIVEVPPPPCPCPFSFKA